MATLKEQAPAFALGTLLPAMISLNIFATKADTLALQARVAETYVTKVEVQEKLQYIQHLMEKVADKVDTLSRKATR